MADAADAAPHHDTYVGCRARISLLMLGPHII